MNFCKQTTSEIDAVRLLNKTDCEAVLNLYQSNPQYFLYCQETPDLTMVIEDMTALPEKKKNAPFDKYFIGYFKAGKLVALMDYIDHYPNEDSGFIGLFMVDGSAHNSHIGKGIIEKLCSAMKEEGYREIRLGVIAENEPAKRFWLKRGFAFNQLFNDTKKYRVEVMVKTL